MELEEKSENSSWGDLEHLNQVSWQTIQQLYVNLMMALEYMSGITKVIDTPIVCTIFHRNPSNSCWDISVWTKVVDQETDITILRISAATMAKKWVFLGRLSFARSIHILLTLATE